MKKQLLALILLGLITVNSLSAQWVFTVTPSFHCYNQSGNQGIARITVTTISNGYSWTVKNPGASTCAAVITPSAGTSGSIASILYPCCGIYTVTSITLDQNSNPVSSISKTLQIYCKIQPTVTSSNATICAGANTSLTALGASSYTWMPGNLTGSTVVVSPSVSTCYTVAASSSTCLGDTSTCVIVTPCTGLHEKQSTTPINVFFSSTSGQIIFERREETEVIYEIRDLLGKLLLSGKFSGSEALNISSLNKGLVIVRCQSSEGAITQKVLIE